MNYTKKTIFLTAAFFAVLAALAIAPKVEASTSSGSNIYVAQSAAGAANGADCSDAYAISFFNTASNWGTGAGQIGPGATVHLCGTITSVMKAMGSGASGNPITILFEPNAMISEPACPYTGCLVLSNQSYITVDGGTNGILQNTANGSNLAEQVSSYGIVGSDSNNITIKNLTVQNLYVQTAGDSKLGDSSIVRCVSWSGSNWDVTNNTFHDAGWCLDDFFNNGDANTTISNNNIYNVGHAVALATSGSNSLSGFFMYGNHIHDTANWADSSCTYHDDGLHMFGVTGSSISNAYIYDNLFDGDWGPCPTGFVFVEDSANLSNSYWWDNVALVQNSPIVNTNGWFGIYSGVSGATQFLNNTVIGPNTTDNTQCVGLGPITNLTFENNVISNCGNPVGAGKVTFSPGNFDNNFYGPSCGNSGNCFAWNNSFTGSFSKWKSATGADAHSVQSNNPLLNSDGSPQAGSPVIGAGLNLSSIATGNLSALAFDTTEGGTRTSLVRPAAAAWDDGAYEYSAGGVVSAPPPSTPPVVPPPTAPVAPVITSSLSASATQGSFFSYQITASNNPTSYAVMGLPTGLSVNTASGIISGTPTAAGNVNVVLNALNSGGIGAATLVINIGGPSTPVSGSTPTTPPPATTYTLSVAKSGTGSGTVSGGGISCGSNCSASVSQGTTMYLGATAGSGSTFEGWSGGCSGSGTCVVRVNANTNVGASFMAMANPVAPIIPPSSPSSPTSTPVSPPFSGTPSGDTPAVAVFTERLAPGSVGAEVYLLQYVLFKDGDFPQGLFTGRFGSLTEAALKAFQAKYSIVSSGSPDSTGYGSTGPRTRIELNALITGIAGN